MGKVPSVIVKTDCPALKDYAPQTLQKAAKELRDLRARDPGAVTPQMMADYRALRDGCRAIPAKPTS